MLTKIGTSLNREEMKKVVGGKEALKNYSCVCSGGGIAWTGAYGSVGEIVGAINGCCGGVGGSCTEAMA